MLKIGSPGPLTGEPHDNATEECLGSARSRSTGFAREGVRSVLQQVALGGKCCAETRSVQTQRARIPDTTSCDSRISELRTFHLWKRDAQLLVARKRDR